MAEQVNEAQTQPDVYHIEVVSAITDPDSASLYWCGESGDGSIDLEDGALICGPCLAAESVAHRILFDWLQGTRIAVLVETLESLDARLQKGENQNGDSS